MFRLFGFQLGGWGEMVDCGWQNKPPLTLASQFFTYKYLDC
jgi:hypothetical protein